MKLVAPTKQSIINRFGPSWRRFFLRFTWAPLPLLLIIWTLDDTVAVGKGQPPALLGALWITLSSIAALWLLAGTAATLGGLEDPVPKNTLTMIASKAFIAGYRLLMVSSVVLLIYNIYPIEAIWNPVFILLIPMTIGGLIASKEAVENLAVCAATLELYVRQKTDVVDKG